MRGQFLSGRESSLTFVLSLNEYINIETSQFLFLQTFDLALSLIWRKRNCEIENHIFSDLIGDLLSFPWRFLHPFLPLSNGDTGGSESANQGVLIWFEGLSSALNDANNGAYTRV